jgi:hypothetical protein
VPIIARGRFSAVCRGYARSRKLKSYESKAKANYA